MSGDTFIGNGSQPFVSANGKTVAGGLFVDIAKPTTNASGITVTGNKAYGNSGYGLYAPGVTDGGDNDMARNSPHQCSGVVCR